MRQIKFLQIFILFFSLFLSFSLKAEEKKVGVASYEVISPDNQAYLQKVVRTSILNSFKEKQSYTTLDLSLSPKDSKEKNFNQILKREKVNALVTGSLLKVGNRFEINSEIYFENWSDGAMTFTDSADDIDRLLPVLKSHVEKLSLQINKMLDRRISVAPLSQKKDSVESPLRQNPSSVSQEVTVSKGKKKREAVEIRDYQWISQQLPFEGRGMAYADLSGDGRNKLILIDLKHVYVYEIGQDKKLKLIANYKGDSLDNFVRVYAIDLNEDKKPEIVISNIRKGQAASLVLQYSQNFLNPLVLNSPWILKAMHWQGKEILLGEIFTGHEMNYHNIKKLKLVDNKLVEQEPFPSPPEIGIYGLSEFPFDQQNPIGLAYLNASGSLKVYQEAESKFKKRGSSSESYGGSSNFIRSEKRNIFNEVEDEFTYINIDPIGWLDQNGRGSVIVAKNENFLKNLIGARPIVKSSYLAKLRWEEIGLREAWNTRKIEGYIVDYQIVKLPEESSPKLLAFVWLREPGFAATMGKFPSAVAMYDLD